MFRTASILLSFVLWFALVSGATAEVSVFKKVSVENGQGARSWIVELASDPSSRSQGLMYRKEMADDRGMLFRFEETRLVSMWMKNTFIALDMIFLKSNGVIASIHRGAVPQSLSIIGSKVPVRFVLEINAGEAKKAGLAVGQTLRHPWFLPNP